MTIPNRNVLWSRVLVDELIKQGVDTACVAPGSRSTPLVTELSERNEIDVFSQLDERCAAFFALGRGKNRTVPTPVVSTSGTAAVNFHPAVVEAAHAHVPLLVLTADRPPVLRESGANQTIDQTELYGSFVRWFHELPEPEPDDRKLSALRRIVARGVSQSMDDPAGPVHLNVPFRKPLAPEETTDVQLEAYLDSTSGPTPDHEQAPIEVTRSPRTPDSHAVSKLVDRVKQVDRFLLVAGPDTGTERDRSSLLTFARQTSTPILADPLSGLRFREDIDTVPVLGGYDAYASAIVDVPALAPELVLRFGNNPTSKALKQSLAEADVEQVLVNPEGNWTDETFSANWLIESSPSALFTALSDPLDDYRVDPDWVRSLTEAERTCFEVVSKFENEQVFEGGYVRRVLEKVPDRTDLFVSNSMPIRDLDRFGQPMAKEVHVFGNRGASGIDGIISSAFGVGSASDRELVLVTGDLAFYHDMNGLIAAGRFNLEATIVVINNDGGGIFHMLPIETYDPPFTEYMKTPHGLDFSHAAGMYGLTYREVEEPDSFSRELEDALGGGSTDLLNVMVDGETSHRRRELLSERIRTAVRNGQIEDT